MYYIGVISDTHGLLREEVKAQLKGCDAILHGGDILDGSSLEELRKIGTLYAVRGNVDGNWADALPKLLETELWGIRIKMAHKKEDLPRDLTGTDLAVFGHSHKYLEQVQGDTRLLNPGSCGPKRFRLPVTMAVVETDGKGICGIKRIDFAQERPEVSGKLPDKKHDRRQLVKAVMRDVDRGKSVEKIAQSNGIDPKLAEQICRMYLTHPGVDVDGILNRIT